MVDREARNKAAHTIERYLHEEIGSYELQDQLESAACASMDRAVLDAHCWMWHFYDDLNDHKIRATKAEWDLFQRLLLILRSDEEMQFMERLPNVRRKRAEALLPYSSVADLLRVRRNVPTFIKEQYPVRLTGSRVRRTIREWWWTILAIIAAIVGVVLGILSEPA